MIEPTVLDYIKSIFKDWQSFTTFLRAWADHADTTQLVESPAVVEDSFLSVEQPAPSESKGLTFNAQPATIFPWRSLLALLLALFAQRMFEPPDQKAMLGVPLYLVALGLAIWAFVRGELTPAPLPASQVNTDPLTVRGGTFLLSVVVSALAFYLMGSNVLTDTPSNTFTGLNVSVWALAIFLHIRSFWLKEPQSLWKRIATSLARPEWTIRITRWGLLVLAVGCRWPSGLANAARADGAQRAVVGSDQQKAVRGQAGSHSDIPALLRHLDPLSAKPGAELVKVAGRGVLCSARSVEQQPDLGVKVPEEGGQQVFP